jgi:hypothetical protein
MQLEQYLDQNGVLRRLMDAGASVPSYTMRFLAWKEISETQLDNSAQVYEPWRLGARKDGSIFAQVEQRNPATDIYTRLILYRREERILLDVIVSMSTLSAPGRTTGEIDAQALADAQIWLSADDCDVAVFDKAGWDAGEQGTYARSLSIPGARLALLAGAEVLEVWITSPLLGRRQNPSMAFKLQTLHDILPALLR